MGAYLQKPVTEKFTEEAENEFLKVASSKMQGWRINQEVCIVINSQIPVNTPKILRKVFFHVLDAL